MLYYINEIAKKGIGSYKISGNMLYLQVID